MNDGQIADVNFALRHRLVPKMKWNSEADSRIAAKQVVEYLEQCGWVFQRRQPSPGHSTGPFMGETTP